MNKGCIDCGRKLLPTRRLKKLKVCSYCYGRTIWKQRYDELKKEFEHHKVLCGKVHLDLWKKLKKHEPNLTWDEEPE